MVISYFKNRIKPTIIVFKNESQKTTGFDSKLLKICHYYGHLVLIAAQVHANNFLYSYDSLNYYTKKIRLYTDAGTEGTHDDFCMSWHGIKACFQSDILQPVWAHHQIIIKSEYNELFLEKARRWIPRKVNGFRGRKSSETWLSLCWVSVDRFRLLIVGLSLLLVANCCVLARVVGCLMSVASLLSVADCLMSAVW